MTREKYLDKVYLPKVFYGMIIKSFGNKETENFIKTGVLKKNCAWRILSKIAQRKIDMVLFANGIDDLQIPPSNRLEKLAGELTGFWSIRINDQFRIVFKCTNNQIYGIKMVDYH